MKMIGVVSVAVISALVAVPAWGQAVKPASSQARPAVSQPEIGAPQPAARQAGAQAISRSVFLANMDTEFRKMDADKNGTITKSEIEGFERAVSVVKAQAQNRQLFARLDADRNGQLSAAEFARLASPSPVNAAPLLAHADLNRDQSITLVEYRTSTLANFDRMDTDKDGVVTPAEMKAGGVGR